MTSLADSIKEALRFRVTTPLFGFFTLSWATWNYRFLVALFSSLPLPEKFLYIDTYIFCDWQSYVLRGALGPLLTTVFLIFVYPYPAKFVFQFYRRRQMELVKLRNEIDGARLLTWEESVQMRRQMLQSESEYKGQIESLTEEISRLKQIAAGRMRIPREEPDSLFSKLQLEPGCVEVLKRLALSGGEKRKIELRELMSYPQVQFDFYVGKLKENHLIDGAGTLSLTQAGREYVLKFNLMDGEKEDREI